MKSQMTDQTAPRFTMRDLYARLADDFGKEQRQVEYYARFLREAGLLDAGQPGRGGRTPPVTPKTAAVFLVGMLGSDTAVGAPDAIKKLKQTQEEAIGEDGKQTAEAVSFVDAVADILEQMSELKTTKQRRKVASRIGVTSDPSGLTGFTSTGSGKFQYVKSYRPVTAVKVMHKEGLLRETSVGSDILTKIADMLSTVES